MKTALVILSVLFTTVLSAQVITMKINNNCDAVMLLDGKPLTDPVKVYDIVLAKESVIKLVLDNPDDRKILVSVKSLLEDNTTAMELHKQNFGADNSISSNENISFKVGGELKNFNIPFRIYFGCDSAAVRSKTIFFSFNPKTNTASTVAANDETSAETVVQPNKKIAESIYNPNSAVYNALKLADNKNVTENELKAIIKFYFPDKPVTDVAQAINAASENPFLKDIITENYRQNLKRIAEVQSATEILSSSVLSSIGGLDVTSFADAFAKFIVKRTKQELNIAFFDKFKQFITKYPDLQTVFPQTYITLNIIGDEIYNYQAYLQTLRESFENDLSALNKNLPTIIDNHPDFFHQHPELAATLNSGCYIAGALQDKVHPGDILNNYPAGYLDSLNKNWKGAIQTLQLFSNSLRDTATNTDSVYWVNSKQINQLVNNATAFKIYLGLIYQDAKNKYAGVHYDFKGKDTTLVQILNALPFDSIYTSYKNFVAHFSEKADNLNMMIKNYRKAGNDSLAYQQYYDYFNSSISLLKQCTEISKLPYLKERLPNLAEAMKDYFDVAQSSAKLVLDVNRRNYASAVVNAVHIYDVVKTKHTSSLKSNKQKNTDELINKDIDDKIKKAANNETVTIINNTINNAAGLTAVAKITDDYNKRQIKQADDNIAINLAQRAAAGETIKLDSTILDSLRRTTLSLLYNKIADDTLKKLYKYGTFMATIVQAKSSDDIENAIEAFALPAGSSRIKRESLFNVSLNAYAGIYAGHERIKGFDKNQFKINSFGVAAPVGIAASIGARKFLWTGNETRNHWSYTMFVSLIDLGAVAAFRFNNDSTVIKNNNTEDTLSASQSSSIQLKNIVSPGLFLSIGIPKSPLSLNFGAQVGPNLRSITSTNGTAKLNFGTNIYWRYSISLVVDIPVLNFYTKSK